MQKKIFIIAEAGVNHNGSLKTAKQLVDAAAKAGADAVKFQTFTAEEVVIEGLPMAEYQRQNCRQKKTYQQMLKGLELGYGDFIKLKRHCDRQGIMFLSTPHSEDAIDFLDDLMPMYKVGSGDLNNIPFLERIATKKKPVILGTGMATLDEIRDALGAIRKKGNNKITVLHCTTNYPCAFDEVNLKAMLTMKNELDCPVGYSDHTQGIEVAIAAAALGACVIEKHFTLDRKMKGPDHAASLLPDELKALVKSIRNVEEAFGSPKKRPTRTERGIKGLLRKSIVAQIDIPEGAVIARDMLGLKRPAVGIRPGDIRKVVGMKTTSGIKKDSVLKWSHLK